MRSRIARIVAAAALLATLAGACSADGTAKEEFIDAADAACRAADEAIAKVGVPRGKGGVDEYVEKATRIGEDLASDLRELEVPAGDAGAVEPVIDGLEEALALLQPLGSAIADRNRRAIAELQQQAERVTNEISEEAESYGFETCGGKVLEPGS